MKANKVLHPGFLMKALIRGHCLYFRGKNFVSRAENPESTSLLSCVTVYKSLGNSYIYNTICNT